LPQGLQGTEEKRYLTIVSYLHDIGKIVSDAGHQKHSAYIIRNLRIPGCSPLESKKLALIALYHRKESPPKKDPLPFGVSGVHADQTRRLTAILRIADGLDEFDIQNVRDLKFKITGKQAMIELKQQNPEALSDLGYFREKASYFEELFGLKLTTFVSAQRREH
jgi:exopolyphosphatase / guanosine-5'-triphosphate,3'-diphosphate pyrophosphatase